MLCIFGFMNYTTVFPSTNLYVSTVPGACMYYINSPETKKKENFFRSLIFLGSSVFAQINNNISTVT